LVARRPFDYDAPPMRRRPGGANVAALLVVVLLAGVYLLAVRQHEQAEGLPHFDTYAYFVPNARYALDALRQGHGLLWNRLQSCGEPFFALAPTGLLYPPHWLLLVLDVHAVLRVLFFLHLVVAGAGMYALGRVVGYGAAGALTGAIAFELGANTIWTAYWSPTILAAYAWMPAALALAERLVRRPTLPATLALAAALALQLLVGYPQLSLFTYQLIALRLAWEAVTRWRASLPRAAVAVAVAAALAPLLCAVQFVPSLEAAAESIRGRSLTLAEIRPAHVTLTWVQFRDWVGKRYAYGALFTCTALLVAGLAGLGRRRRVTLFYLLAGAVYFALAFDTPLFHLYRRLPAGSTFREPHRFLWVTAVVGCVVVAAGADALVRGVARRGRRALAVLAVLAVGAGYAVLSPTGLRPREVALGALVVGAAALPGTRGRRRLVAVALPAVLAAQLLVANWTQIFKYVHDDTILLQHRAAFAAVRARLTPQDRMYMVPGAGSVGWQGLHDGMIKKAGELFGVPAIVDYELQTSDRYADLLVRMFMGTPMTSLNQFAFLDLAPVPASRPLFDLLATRFVVIDRARAETLHWPAAPGFTLAWQEGEQRVYENPRALPRARFVPQVRVAGDAAAVLEALATGTDDPRRMALVEGAPATLLGTPGATGRADVVADRSESLVVRVEASAPGFLVVADQLYPGWEATIDGRPAPIRRGDFAFRLVAVPAGTSEVRFRYRPRSLVVGAAVSAATLLAVLVAVLWASRIRRRRRPAAYPPPAAARARDAAGAA
jgi:hypothetical protein